MVYTRKISKFIERNSGSNYYIETPGYVHIGPGQDYTRMN